MKKSSSPSSLPNVPRLLTLRQVLEELGLRPGELVALRAAGNKLYDPTFPKPTHGFFFASEINNWKEGKSERAIQSGWETPLSGKVVIQDRRIVKDRRVQHE